MDSNFSGCPPGYSDRTDFLRYEGFGCPLPIVADIVLWSLVLVFALRILALHPGSCTDQVFIYKRNLHCDAQRGIKGVRLHKHPPLVILFFSFTYILAMALLALVKMCAREHGTLGKDVAVSVLFVYTTCVGFATGNASHLSTVKTLLSSLSLGKSVERRLFLQLYIPTVLSTMFYALSVVGSITAGFIVGRDVSPVDSPMVYVILLRHFAIVFVLCCGFQISRRLQKSTKEVLGQIASVGDIQGSSACSTKNDRLTKAMDRISKASKKRKVLATVAILIYSVFSIPFFWPLQSIAISFTLLLSLDPKASLPSRYRTNPNNTTKPMNSLNAPTSRMGPEKLSTAQ